MPSSGRQCCRRAVQAGKPDFSDSAVSRGQSCRQEECVCRRTRHGLLRHLMQMSVGHAERRGSDIRPMLKKRTARLSPFRAQRIKSIAIHAVRLGGNAYAVARSAVKPAKQHGRRRTPHTGRSSPSRRTGIARDINRLTLEPPDKRSATRL